MSSATAAAQDPFDRYNNKRITMECITDNDILKAWVEGDDVTLMAGFPLGGVVDGKTVIRNGNKQQYIIRQASMEFFLDFDNKKVRIWGFEFQCF